jgi:hypothetical protein
MRVLLSVFALNLIVCNEVFAQAGRSVQLPFSGTTFASELLIHDVMRKVMEVGDAEFDCPAPDAVVAEVSPVDFQPTDPALTPVGAVQTVYERWTIGFCGNTVPFLISFWTLEQGGTAFDLRYWPDEIMAAINETQSPLH